MPDDPGLFAPETAGEEPDQDTPSPFFRLVEAAEELLGGAKIGRPRGSRNRKSEAFEKWYFAKGYKDPAQLLGELVTADPLALARAIGGKATTIDVVNLQRAAAGELMPYLHSKKPIDVALVDERLPMLAIITGDNQLDQARRLLEDRQNALSVGSPIVEGEASEIKDLEGEK